MACHAISCPHATYRALLRINGALLEIYRALLRIYRALLANMQCCFVDI